MLSSTSRRSERAEDGTASAAEVLHSNFLPGAWAGICECAEDLAAFMSTSCSAILLVMDAPPEASLVAPISTASILPVPSAAFGNDFFTGDLMLEVGVGVAAVALFAFSRVYRTPSFNGQPRLAEQRLEQEILERDPFLLQLEHKPGASGALPGTGDTGGTAEEEMLESTAAESVEAKPGTALADQIAQASDDRFGQDPFLIQVEQEGLAASGSTRDKQEARAFAEGDGTLDFNLHSEAGSYVLSVFSGERTACEQKGGYTFDRRSGHIQDDTGNSCGCFSTQGLPPSFAIPEDGGKKFLKCITVTNSEIMVEIQKPTNDNAFFVLPSQLNGAEYQSFERDYIVKEIDDYQWDNTGGPRGQLAVHPAAGQFILDNAANDIRPDGISAVANVIKEVADEGYDFELQNGYLKVPVGGALKAVEAWKTALKKFKMLVMEDVPASGLKPDKAGFSAAAHRVNLVYASAVPVQTYNNGYGDRDMQIQVAATTLVAQYYGALSVAARRGTQAAPKVVYLMPLGGGVFENPPEIIVHGMSLAVEMLSQEELQCLDVHILTFHRNAAEVQEFKRLLGVFQKLKDSAN